MGEELLRDDRRMDEIQAPDGIRPMPECWAAVVEMLMHLPRVVELAAAGRTEELKRSSEYLLRLSDKLHYGGCRVSVR